jgi:hypothetical protein
MIDFHKIYEWAHSRNLYTWIGHGILGFLITVAFGPVATFVAFLYREVSDVLGAWSRGEPIKWRDGFFDLWAPLAGAAIAVVLFR